jgi:two-component system, chemotaxis family, protein-glutamate methylesterase/glutaminase
LLHPSADHADVHPSGIVVIASSAGGIEALITILHGLPEDFPAPIVIVQHRPAARESSLVSILRRKTKLHVKDAIANETLDAGTVYLAGPDEHLTVTDDFCFQYTDGRRIHHLQSSANPLFESAAEYYGKNAIALVLTGIDSDGTDGIQAIRAHGGVVIVQDKTTSEHFDMPHSAIATGVVDHILPLSEIGPMLSRLVGCETVANEKTPQANGDRIPQFHSCGRLLSER